MEYLRKRPPAARSSPVQPLGNGEMLYPKSYGVNPLYPKAEDFEVVPRDDHSGLGVITYKDIKAGELIAHVFGEVVDKIGQHTLQISKTQHLYDPYFTGYLLHSCAPNVSLNMKELTLTALADIPAGTFLFMDYAETEDKLFKQFICSCGAPNCRTVITGRKEKPRLPMPETLLKNLVLVQV